MGKAKGKSKSAKQARIKTVERRKTRAELATRSLHLETDSTSAMLEFIDKVVTSGISGLKTEFEKIGQPKALASIAFKANANKNRYSNVYCFDKTRVVLNYLVPPESDYVHANYVKSNLTTLESSFICTQAPTEKTINDFWRMVWQEKPKFIVMLCRLIENKKPKCALYWPEKNGTSTTFGTIKVTNEGDGGKEDESVFDIEKFRVESGDSQSFVVKHIRWLDWPDFGIPSSGLGMLRLMRKVNSEPGTAIVHCSAGIGRTGTIIGAEVIMKALVAGKRLSVQKVVQNLREQRYGMVQTFSQYIYLHFSICAYCERKLENVATAAAQLNRLKEFFVAYKEFASKEEAADRKLAAQGFDTRNATARR